MRFLLAGGLAAAANFGSRFLYSAITDFRTAVILAFITGLITGYLLNKRFVFATSQNTVKTEITWFLLVNLLALIQTWGLSVYLADYLLPNYIDSRQWSEAIAHFVGVIFPVFTSFFGHKYLTFRE